jgi:rubrerythrin
MFSTETGAELFGGTGPGESDSMMLTDMLMTEKFVSGSYDTSIFETSNPQVRQALQHIQRDEQKHGERLRNQMEPTAQQSAQQQ